MQPDSVIVYLDENHCNNRKILSVLEKASIRVERHLTHFQRGTPDEVWLPFVGENGWILLTTDKRIRFRANEKEAVIRHRVRMFYFSKNDLSGSQMAVALEKAIPQIRKICEKHAPPFFAAITRSGEVYLKENFLEP